VADAFPRGGPANTGPPQRPKSREEPATGQDQIESPPAATAAPEEHVGHESFDAHRLFLRRLNYVAALSAISIVLLTGFGVWTVVSHYVIRQAENLSMGISAALSTSELSSFFPATPRGAKEAPCELPPERLRALDARIRQFLNPFDIVKVKVYTADGCILFSTDPTIIGQRDAGNRRLRNALDGRSNAQLVRRDRVQDLTDEQRLDADVVEAYVPIRNTGGEVIGCFEAYMDVSRYRGEIRQIVSLAVAVISAILLGVHAASRAILRKITVQLKEGQDMLELYAASDPLTGLSNRRHLLVRARQEVARLRRELAHDRVHPGLSVTILDLDHFKNINDTHGHLVGDAVLKETARRILAMTRSYDLAGRLGGEEFIVVHPNSDYSEARGIARRIWQAIRAEPYVIEGRTINVTASLGVATFEPATEDDLTPALERADRALYGAKHAGRDRVV
jgi:diguanylate cyclase (GGDEF)-like protein